MKIRKNHRRKRYRYNINRKNLNKKHKSNGRVTDPVLKTLWDNGKLPKRNFKETGLSDNPNKTISVPNYKRERCQLTKFLIDGKMDKSSKKTTKLHPKRQRIIEQLEELAKEKAESKFRLPKGIVELLTYFLDKYHFNYKAMANDDRNDEQWTWKQFRMRIKQFRNIPEQFNAYLIARNLPINEQLSWEEYDSDSEWR